MRSDARKRLAPDSITIPLDWDRPPLTSNRTRGNPYVQHVKTAKALGEARASVAAVKPPKIVGAEATLHFRPATRHRRDCDGLYPTLKVVLDALVRFGRDKTNGIPGVLPDDSWVHVPAATCRIHPPNGEPAAMWLSLEHVHHYEPGVKP